MTEPSDARAPGWYADPADPRLERWWTGTEWSSHRALKSTWEPLSYLRSCRLGPNRHARGAFAALVLSGGAGLAMVWLSLLSSRWAGVGAWVLPLLILTVCGAVLGIGLASAGLRRSAQFGARAACVNLIGVGTLQILAVIVAVALRSSGLLTLD